MGDAGPPVGSVWNSERRCPFYCLEARSSSIKREGSNPLKGWHSMPALGQKRVSLPACQAVRSRGHGGPQPPGPSRVKEHVLPA